MTHVYRCSCWIYGHLITRTGEFTSLDAATQRFMEVPGFDKFEDSPYLLQY